jgi:hypothetical protein
MGFLDWSCQHVRTSARPRSFLVRPSSGARLILCQSRKPFLSTDVTFFVIIALNTLTSNYERTCHWRHCYTRHQDRKHPPYIPIVSAVGEPRTARVKAARAEVVRRSKIMPRIVVKNVHHLVHQNLQNIVHMVNMGRHEQIA